MLTKIFIGLLAVLTAPLAAATVNVDVHDSYFNPNDLTVAPGDTVQWNFVGSLQHSVVSNGAAESFNSGAFQTSGTFSHTFTVIGTDPYYCGNHGLAMAGVIRVANPTPTPTPTYGPCVNSSDSPDLFVSFNAFPPVVSGDPLTVVLVMAPGSGGGSYNTSVVIEPRPAPGVTVVPQATAVPVVTLAAGGSNQYTWVYGISGTGTLSFSATGSGSDLAVCGACTYRDSVACSGFMDVVQPSPTPTPTLSDPQLTQTSVALSWTPTPPYGQVAGDASLMGPVPVKPGVPLCAFAKPSSGPADGTVEVFNSAGEHITSARVSPGDACVQTSSWAPGIYWLQLKLNGESHWQKVAVTP
jgi:plastocyanin